MVDENAWTSISLRPSTKEALEKLRSAIHPRATWDELMEKLMKLVEKGAWP